MKNFTLTLALTVLSAATVLANAPARMIQGKQLTPEAQIEALAKKTQEQINSYNLGLRPMKAPAKIVEFDEPEVLLYEDFSLMTAGSEEAPDDTMLPEDYMDTGNQFLPDGYTLTSGWWGLGIYQAGGCCFLGYPGIGGCITTPMLNLNGRIRVSFRMKPGNNVTSSASIIFSLLKGDQYNPTLIIDNVYEYIKVNADDDWTEFTYIYDVEYSGDDAYVQFNGMTYDNGKFIDDIKIERLGYLLSAPEAYAPTDYEGDSFTATWNSQAITDDYALTVYSRTINEGASESFSTDFSDGIVPAYVDASDDEVCEIAGMPGDKALQVLNGQEIIIGNGNIINNLELNIFCLSDELEGTAGYVYFYGLKNNEWKSSVFYGGCDYSTEKGSRYKVTAEYGMANQYEKIKLVFNILTDLPVYLDDIQLTTSNSVDYNFVLNAEPVSGTSYEVENLDPYEDYFYYVNAVLGDQVSDASNLVKVYQLVAPVALEATDIDDRGGFTANWEATPKAEEYQASVFNVTTLADDIDAYPILTETFSNAVADDATVDYPYDFENYYDLLSFDEYTDNAGWDGCFNIMAEGMIGCGDDYYGISELCSPKFDASNNDGIFTVDFDCYCLYGGDIMIVQNSEITYERVHLGTGLNHYSVTFDQGSKESYVLFYTSYGYPFLIDNFVISQDLKAGEKLSTLVAQSDWVEDTSAYIPGVKATEGYDLCYSVTARYTREETTYKSPSSELVVVKKDTSAIESIKAEKAGNGKIYDLLGRPVGDNIDALQRGIYIMNGKVIRK